MVRSIATALARPAEGERIAREIERRAERVRAAAAGKPAVRWAYLIWRKPWMSVNRETFAHAMLELPGGLNVFAERAERYPAFEVTALAELRPDVVFLGTEPYPFQSRHADELALLTGLDAARFRIADGEFLSWHGSRTPAGIDHAESLISEARARAGANAAR
jgi:ABC-type Fe3+-hydroxamate transport system substrate-binding protein